MQQQQKRQHNEKQRGNNTTNIQIDDHDEQAETID